MEPLSASKAKSNLKMSIRVQKRKYTRSQTACDNCRRRKTRCDSTSPVCGNCAREGTACVFPVLPQPSNDLRSFDVNCRIDSLENTMHRLVNYGIQEIKSSIEAQSRPSQLSGNLSSNGYPSWVTEREIGVSSAFNDKLRHLKFHTSGNQQSTPVYTSAALTSILKPSDIDMLSKLLDDSHIWQTIEERSFEVWRTSQALQAVLFDATSPPVFELDYYERCLEIYLNTDSPYIHSLIGPQDLTSHLLSSSHPLNKGISAAIIIVGSVSMRLDISHEQFSYEDIARYENAGYYQAIRTLNFIRFSTLGFLEVRLSMLLVWLLYTFSSYPSILHLFTPVIQMAKSVGINRCETSPTDLTADEITHRSAVWFLITNFQYLLAITMSSRALEPQPESSISSYSPFLDSGTAALKYSAGIHNIYDEAYDRLFDTSGKRSSGIFVYEEIQALDEKLESWRKNIPSEVWNTEIPSASGLPSFLRSFPSGNLKYKYYHTVIAVHSVAAFSSDFESSDQALSLTKVSRAARALFQASLASQLAKEDCTLLHTCGITASIMCFVYKQLRCPYTESNAQDLYLIRNNVELFSVNGLVPTHRTPVSIVWETLVELMNRHYQVNQATSVTSYSDQQDSPMVRTNSPTLGSGTCIIS